MVYEKIVLVTRKTRLEGLVERFNTRSQARFYLEQSDVHQQSRAQPPAAAPPRGGQRSAGGKPQSPASAPSSFALYEREHETYHAALNALRERLQKLTKLHLIERSFLPNYVFAENDLVVTIGIDGLVVNTAKYLSGQPLIAVNPDPAHIDGVLLPFNVAQAGEVAARALKGQFSVREIRMAEARLNDGQVLRAFNDLFVGVNSHISARYHLRFQAREEDQSSSGIIISTGVGATGWLSSLFNMADQLWAGFGSTNIPLPRPALDWESDRLVFVVREPFISKTSTARLVCGIITPDEPLLIESQMPDRGVIFSDGVEADFLAFNAGGSARIGLAEQKTRFVIG